MISKQNLPDLGPSEGRAFLKAKCNLDFDDFLAKKV